MEASTKRRSWLAVLMTTMALVFAALMPSPARAEEYQAFGYDVPTTLSEALAASDDAATIPSASTRSALASALSPQASSVYIALNITLDGQPYTGNAPGTYQLIGSDWRGQAQTWTAGSTAELQTGSSWSVVNVVANVGYSVGSVTPGWSGTASADGSITVNFVTNSSPEPEPTVATSQFDVNFMIRDSANSQYVKYNYQNAALYSGSPYTDGTGYDGIAGGFDVALTYPDANAGNFTNCIDAWSALPQGTYWTILNVGPVAGYTYEGATVNGAQATPGSFSGTIGTEATEVLLYFTGTAAAGGAYEVKVALNGVIVSGDDAPGTFDITLAANEQTYKQESGVSYSTGAMYFNSDYVITNIRAKYGYYFDPENTICLPSGNGDWGTAQPYTDETGHFSYAGNSGSTTYGCVILNFMTLPLYEVKVAADGVVWDGTGIAPGTFDIALAYPSWAHSNLYGNYESEATGKDPETGRALKYEAGVSYSTGTMPQGTDYVVTNIKPSDGYVFDPASTICVPYGAEGVWGTADYTIENGEYAYRGNSNAASYGCIILSFKKAPTYEVMVAIDGVIWDRTGNAPGTFDLTLTYADGRTEKVADDQGYSTAGLPYGTTYMVDNIKSNTYALDFDPFGTFCTPTANGSWGVATASVDPNDGEHGRYYYTGNSGTASYGGLILNFKTLPKFDILVAVDGEIYDSYDTSKAPGVFDTLLIYPQYAFVNLRGEYEGEANGQEADGRSRRLLSQQSKVSGILPNNTNYLVSNINANPGYTFDPEGTVCVPYGEEGTWGKADASHGQDGRPYYQGNSNAASYGCLILNFKKEPTYDVKITIDGIEWNGTGTAPGTFDIKLSDASGVYKQQTGVSSSSGELRYNTDYVVNNIKAAEGYVFSPETTTCVPYGPTGGWHVADYNSSIGGYSYNTGGSQYGCLILDFKPAADDTHALTVRADGETGVSGVQVSYNGRTFNASGATPASTTMKTNETATLTVTLENPDLDVVWHRSGTNTVYPLEQILKSGNTFVYLLPMGDEDVDIIAKGDPTKPINPLTLKGDDGIDTAVATYGSNGINVKGNGQDVLSRVGQNGKVTLFASPTANYAFTRWTIEEGESTGARLYNANSASGAYVIMGSGPVTIKANTDDKPHTLTIDTSDEGVAGVTFDGASKAGNKIDLYDGATVTVKLSRAAGYEEAYTFDWAELAGANTNYTFKQQAGNPDAIVFTMGNGDVTLKPESVKGESWHTLTVLCDDGVASIEILNTSKKASGSDPASEAMLEDDTRDLRVTLSSGYSGVEWFDAATGEPYTKLGTGTSGNVFTFTMGDKDVSLKAKGTLDVKLESSEGITKVAGAYKSVTRSASGSTGNVTISGVSKDGVVTLSADIDDNYTFDRWEVVSGNGTEALADSTSPNTTLTVGTAPVTVKAYATSKPLYKLTVQPGEGIASVKMGDDTSTDSVSTMLATGTQSPAITVTRQTGLTGVYNVRWTVVPSDTGHKLTQIDSNSTYFTMGTPANGGEVTLIPSLVKVGDVSHKLSVKIDTKHLEWATISYGGQTSTATGSTTAKAANMTIPENGEATLTIRVKEGHGLTDEPIVNPGANTGYALLNGDATKRTYEKTFLMGNGDVTMSFTGYDLDGGTLTATALIGVDQVTIESDGDTFTAETSKSASTFVELDSDATITVSAADGFTLDEEPTVTKGGNSGFKLLALNKTATSNTYAFTMGSSNVGLSFGATENAEVATGTVTLVGAAGITQATATHGNDVARVEGAGSGNLEGVPGSGQVPLTATVDDAHVFVGWTVEGNGQLADPSSPNTTLTTPSDASDVTVKANTRAKNTLTIVPGTGVDGITFDGAYKDGNAIKLDKDEATNVKVVRSSNYSDVGYKLNVTLVDNVGKDTGYEYTVNNANDAINFTMGSGDVKLKVELAPEAYTLTVDTSDPGVTRVLLDGEEVPSGGVSVRKGTSHILTVVLADDYDFDRWTPLAGAGTGYQLGSGMTPTFVIGSGDVSLKPTTTAKPAVNTHTLTVQVGEGVNSIEVLYGNGESAKAQGSNGSASVTLAKDATAFLVVKKDSDYEDVTWYRILDGTKRSSSLAQELTSGDGDTLVYKFKMPDNDITLQADATEAIVANSLYLSGEEGIKGITAIYNGKSYGWSASADARRISNVKHNGEVALSAQLEDGYVFDKWVIVAGESAGTDIDGISSDDAVLSMGSATSRVKAVAKRAAAHRLTVVPGEGIDDVTVTVNGAEVNASSGYLLHPGETARITVDRQPGYVNGYQIDWPATNGEDNYTYSFTRDGDNAINFVMGSEDVTLEPQAKRNSSWHSLGVWAGTGVKSVKTIVNNVPVDATLTEPSSVSMTSGSTATLVVTVEDDYTNATWKNHDTLLPYTGATLVGNDGNVYTYTVTMGNADINIEAQGTDPIVRNSLTVTNGEGITSSSFQYPSGIVHEVEALGTVTVSNVKEGTRIPLSAVVNTDGGYEFDEWSLDPTSGATIETPESATDAVLVMGSVPVTVTAKAKRVQHTLTVEFFNTGGSEGIQSVSAEIISGDGTVAQQDGKTIVTGLRECDEVSLEVALTTHGAFLDWQLVVGGYDSLGSGEGDSHKITYAMGKEDTTIVALGTSVRASSLMMQADSGIKSVVVTMGDGVKETYDSEDLRSYPTITRANDEELAFKVEYNSGYKLSVSESGKVGITTRSASTGLDTTDEWIQLSKNVRNPTHTVLAAMGSDSGVLQLSSTYVPYSITLEDSKSASDSGLAGFSARLENEDDELGVYSSQTRGYEARGAVHLSDNVIIQAELKKGYQFDGWSFKNKSGDSVKETGDALTDVSSGSTIRSKSSPVTVVTIGASNVNLVANYSLATYRVVAPPDDYVDLSVTTPNEDPTAPVNGGDPITITATPHDGYKVTSITVTPENGDPFTVTPDQDGKYRFSMPASNVTVSATHVALKYVVTVVEDENGKAVVTHDDSRRYIVGEKVGLPIGVEYGFDYTVVAQPKKATVEAPATYSYTNGQGENRTYTFTMPASDVTVKVTSTPHTFNVETVGEQGVALNLSDGSTKGEYNYGAPVKVVFDDTDSNYKVTGLVFRRVGSNVVLEDFDFAPQGDNGYTFTMPYYDIYVTPQLTAKSYLLTTGNSEHGNVSVVNDTADHRHAYDSIVTLRTTHPSDYKLGSFTFTDIHTGEVVAVKVGASSDASDNELWTFQMPANDVQVVASFVRDTDSLYSVGADDAHYTHSVINGAEHRAGEKIYITITPDENYAVAANVRQTYTYGDGTTGDLVFEGKNGAGVYTYSFTMPAGDVEVHAVVGPIYHVTVEGTDELSNWSVTVNDETLTAEAFDVTIGDRIATPVLPDVREGFKFDGWSISVANDGQAMLPYVVPSTLAAGSEIVITAETDPISYVIRFDTRRSKTEELIRGGGPLLMSALAADDETTTSDEIWELKAGPDVPAITIDRPFNYGGDPIENIPGYTFTGWTPEPNVAAAGYPDYTPYGFMTVSSILKSYPEAMTEVAGERIVTVYGVWTRDTVTNAGTTVTFNLLPNARETETSYPMFVGSNNYNFGVTSVTVNSLLGSVDIQCPFSVKPIGQSGNASAIVASANFVGWSTEPLRGPDAEPGAVDHTYQYAIFTKSATNATIEERAESLGALLFLKDRVDATHPAYRTVMSAKVELTAELLSRATKNADGTYSMNLYAVWAR